MVRVSSVFVCQQCGYESAKWSGQCPGCGEWNSLVESVVEVSGGRRRGARRIEASKPIALKKVVSKALGRVSSGMAELDRVLGGGMVPGSAILVAGEPGIGKSTLLTQLALNLARTSQKQIWYVSGEESPEQLKLRIERLETGRKGEVGERLMLFSETDVDALVAAIKQEADKVGLIIVDSVQTLVTAEMTGMAGSVGQVRECTGRLMAVTKREQIPLFLVGHVTKEGTIAGPKVLEHMVDGVFHLEGESKHIWRILRGVKNRFGATDEVGVFEMTEGGMKEVKNPSDVFLEERQSGVPGSVVAVVMEGTRPVLVEVQALVVPSQLAIPRRVAAGVEQRRLQLLLAMLTKRGRIPLGTQDVFINIAGGLRVEEPGIDLAICVAVVSSFKNRPVRNRLAVIGEVGLLGEVRPVAFLKKRITEARKLGYRQLVTPDQCKTVMVGLKLAM